MQLRRCQCRTCGTPIRGLSIRRQEMCVALIGNGAIPSSDARVVCENAAAAVGPSLRDEPTKHWGD